CWPTSRSCTSRRVSEPTQLSRECASFGMVGLRYRFRTADCPPDEDQLLPHPVQLPSHFLWPGPGFWSGGSPLPPPVPPSNPRCFLTNAKACCCASFVAFKSGRRPSFGRKP